MTIIELESIRNTYLNLISDIVLGKIDKRIEGKIGASIKTLDGYIDAMPVEKEEHHYVAIYLAYEFYRLRAEYLRPEI